MKLKPHIQTIDLYPTIDSTLTCIGKIMTFPGDLRGTIVKRKKSISLIRIRRAGFAWVNNSDIAPGR